MHRPVVGTTASPIHPRRLAVAPLVAALLLPTALRAQEPGAPWAHRTTAAAVQGPHGFLFRAPRVSLGIRGGFDFRHARSGIFDFVTDQLTLGRSDFNAFTLGGDLGVRLSGPLDLLLGAAYTRTSRRSEVRDYVDQDGLPITQRTTLSTTPLTLAVRAYVTPRGRQIGRFVWIPARFAPYVGAGFGTVRFAFEQVGSFVDLRDLSIFDDTFQSSGWTPLGMVLAGADYNFSPRIFVNVDARYMRAKGELGDDFVEFADGIDLSGLQCSVGVYFRF